MAPRSMRNLKISLRGTHEILLRYIMRVGLVQPASIILRISMQISNLDLFLDPNLDLLIVDTVMGIIFRLLFKVMKA